MAKTPRFLEPVYPEEALSKVLSALNLKPEAEKVKLEKAYGRILAEDLCSPEDIPPYNMAFFDGYAVRVEDLKGASEDKPVRLRVAGKIELQTRKPPKIRPGEAYKTATGAPIPEGANLLIPFEWTREENGEIVVNREIEPWKFVIVKGKDFTKGSTILKAGRRLRVQDLSLLFRLRIKAVKVYGKPKVGLISVGSELTTNLNVKDPLKVPASHGILFEKLVEALGGEPKYLGVVPDSLEAITAKLREAVKKFDIVATLGGSSVGEKDLVAKAVNRLGKPGMVVNGLKVRPGAATRLGIARGKPIVLIPGLIQSAIVGFHFLLLPLILAKLGLTLEDYRPTVKAKIGQSLTFIDRFGYRRIHFVKLNRRTDGFEAEPLVGESPLMRIPVNASGYIIPPRGKEKAEPGELVDVYMVPGLFQLGEE